MSLGIMEKITMVLEEGANPVPMPMAMPYSLAMPMAAPSPA